MVREGWEEVMMGKESKKERKSYRILKKRKGKPVDKVSLKGKVNVERKEGKKTG